MIDVILSDDVREDFRTSPALHTDQTLAQLIYFLVLLVPGSALENLDSTFRSSGSSDDDSARSHLGGSSPGPGQVTDIGQAPSVTSCEAPLVTSYLVATSPEVLTQLLRENEARGLEFNPALYTTPANALNTSKVDFAPGGPGHQPGHPPPSPRPRHMSQCSASGSLERCGSRPNRDQYQGQVITFDQSQRSAPGSAHSTLSRAGSGSPASSLEKRYPGLRRKTSFGASLHSSCQVTPSPSPFLFALLSHLLSCLCRISFS